MLQSNTAWRGRPRRARSFSSSLQLVHRAMWHCVGYARLACFGRQTKESGRRPSGEEVAQVSDMGPLRPSRRERAPCQTRCDLTRHSQASILTSTCPFPKADFWNDGAQGGRELGGMGKLRQGPSDAGGGRCAVETVSTCLPPYLRITVARLMCNAFSRAVRTGVRGERCHLGCAAPDAYDGTCSLPTRRVANNPPASFWRPHRLIRQRAVLADATHLGDPELVTIAASAVPPVAHLRHVNRASRRSAPACASPTRTCTTHWSCALLCALVRLCACALVRLCACALVRWC